MEVNIFDDPDHPAAALVRAEFEQDGSDNGITGKGRNLTLEINLAHSRPVDESTDGGEPPQYVSRVIAHRDCSRNYDDNNEFWRFRYMVQ